MRTMLQKMLDYVKNLFKKKEPEPDNQIVVNFDEDDYITIDCSDVEMSDTYTDVSVDADDYTDPPFDGTPIVSIDFDGVIHSYVSGWQGADVIPDAPVGTVLRRSKIVYSAIDWLTELIRDDRIHVAIFSSRNHQEGGIKAMKAFLLDNGLEFEDLVKIYFPEHKPPSHVSIDDRCMTFKGSFFSADEILNFKPWIQ